MERIKLNVTKRSELGSSAMRRLRLNGIIPGIVYGKGEDSIPVKISISDIHSVKGGYLAENVLLDLTVKENGGNLNKTVIIKEIQKDAIRGDWLHIDFNEISLKEKLKTKVAVEITGTAVGVAQGGILEQIMHELEIECLPTDIPPHIDIDVTNLNIGQTIYVKDITVPQKVTVLSDSEQPVVSVAVPRAEEEVAPAPVEGEPAEPEVISKGKKEEEEIEGAPEAKPKEEAKAKEKEEKKSAKESK